MIELDYNKEDLVEEVIDFINRGKKEKYKYVIVVCDGFSYENYPSYHNTLEDLMFSLPRFQTNMQRVEIIIDLEKDKRILI
jgi:hypothetical protein